MAPRLWGCLALLLACSASADEILIKARQQLQALCRCLPPLPPPLPPRQSGAPVISPDRQPQMLQGGTVVNADRHFQADVLIKDGVIVDLRPDIPVCVPAAARHTAA